MLIELVWAQVQNSSFPITSYAKSNGCEPTLIITEVLEPFSDDLIVFPSIW